MDDVGPPSDDIDSLYNDEKDEDENGLIVPTESLKRPFTANKKKVITSCVNWGVVERMTILKF